VFLSSLSSTGLLPVEKCRERSLRLDRLLRKARITCIRATPRTPASSSPRGTRVVRLSHRRRRTRCGVVARAGRSSSAAHRGNRQKAPARGGRDDSSQRAHRANGTYGGEGGCAVASLRGPIVACPPLCLGSCSPRSRSGDRIGRTDFVASARQVTTPAARRTTARRGRHRSPHRFRRVARSSDSRPSTGLPRAPA
jgi:hypothetical protein